MKTLLITLLLLITVQTVEAKELEFPDHRNSMTIRWETDPVKIDKAIKKWQKKHPAPIEALALWKGNRCTIYALEPEEDYDDQMTLLGHEFTHCFKGSFHKN